MDIMVNFNFCKCYNAIPSFLSQIFSTCCRIALNGFALYSGCFMTALNRSISLFISFPFGRTLISIFRDRSSRSFAMMSSNVSPRASKLTLNFFFGRFRFVDFFSWISEAYISYYYPVDVGLLFKNAECFACRFSSFVRCTDST